MKVFTAITSFKNKVNFIDRNNVVVGYDTAQQCCEAAGWYLSYTETPDTANENTIPDALAEDYDFATDYCKETDCSASFRLVPHQGGLPCLFLHLYNLHDGYYYHGFSMTLSGVDIHTGDI